MKSPIELSKLFILRLLYDLIYKKFTNWNKQKMKRILNHKNKFKRIYLNNCRVDMFLKKQYLFIAVLIENIAITGSKNQLKFLEL